MRCRIKRTTLYLVISVVICTLTGVFFLLMPKRPKSVDVVGELYVDPSAHLAKSLQNRTKKVNLGLFEFLIKGQDICGDSGTRPYLVIIIITAHRNREARNSIRQTWGGQAVKRLWPHRYIGEDVRLAFLLGRSASEQQNEQLKRESEEFQDIVQGDFLDTYANLSRKTLSGLRWSSLYCPAHFVLKADDDTFVHIPDSLAVLKSNPPKANGTVYGKVAEGAKPWRSGKYTLEYNEYKYDWYPTFMFGPVYVVSGNIVSKLVNVSEYVHFIKLEDVFITGWLASGVSAERVAVTGFLTTHSNLFTRACSIWSGDAIAEHYVASMAMQFIWKGLEYNMQDCRQINYVLFLASFVLLVLFGKLLWRHRTYIRANFQYQI